MGRVRIMTQPIREKEFYKKGQINGKTLLRRRNYMCRVRMMTQTYASQIDESSERRIELPK